MREPLAHLVESRQGADEERDDEADEHEPAGATGEAGRAEFARERFRAGRGHPSGFSQPGQMGLMLK
jgi:hypothetical protein